MANACSPKIIASDTKYQTTASCENTEPNPATAAAWLSYNQRAPIVYEAELGIRFSDLDMYGHVSSKHYLDLVNTSRSIYAGNVLNFSLMEMAARGIGFVLAKATTNFRRPIVGLKPVMVSSFTREIRDGRTFVTPFKIANLDGTRVYSDGEIEYHSIDIKTGRSTEAPDWVIDFLGKI